MTTRRFSSPQPRPASAAPAPGPAAPAPARPAGPAPAIGVPKFAASPLPSRVSDTIASAGQPLDGVTRGAMESQLGHDLGGVRVHTDAAAGAAARAAQARAYTVGQHVAFAPGTYAPATTDGRRLLAHELVHTLQQRSASGMTTTASPKLLPPDHAAEREAAQLARGPAATPAPVSVRATGLVLAREEAAEPAWGSTLWSLNFAKDLIRRTPTGEGALSGMVDAHLAIEVRLRGGGTKLYTVRHPWKRIEGGGMADSTRWVIEEVVEPSAYAGDPKITVDELGHLGDLALALFREYRKVSWAKQDPASLQKSIEQDDSLKGREAYAQGMEDAVIYRNQEQLRFKEALIDQGVTVTTKLPFEDEYREAYYKGITDSLASKGDINRAGWDGRSAADRVIKDIIQTGKSLTHTGLTYGTHYGQLWDTQREAWAQKNPELAMKRSQDRRMTAGIEALAEFVNRVDPTGADADEAVELIDSFAMLYGGAATILFVSRAEKGLERLLGPFGFRMVEGVGVGGLQQRRLEYALLNYRALEPRDRAMIRYLPHQAAKYGINTFPTHAELEAKDRLVAIRTLPDGTLHTGTLAEFRWASDNNRILHALRQLEMIRSGGPASLVGRIVDGERGAAIGAMFDTYLMVRAPMNARRNMQTQMNRMSSGGNSVGRDAPLVPLSPRAPAPPRTPAPTPSPFRVPDTEVVATNARNPQAVIQQTPDAHQARWVQFGGTGHAPPAYRTHNDVVYLSTDSWLLAPATRAGAPLPTGSGAPARPLAPPPAPAPVQAQPQPPAPAPRPPDRPRPPAPSVQAPSVELPAPAPGVAFDKTAPPPGIAVDKTVPPPPAGQQPSQGGARIRPPAGNQVVRPDGTTGPAIPPPNGIGLDRVRAFMRMTRIPGRLNTNVLFTLNDFEHTRAWRLSGGFNDAPPAFFYDHVVYVHPTLRGQLTSSP